MNKSKISGWALSGIVVLFLIGPSAMGKFAQWEGKSDMFANMGWTEDQMFYVGIVEIIISILFLIPRTSFVAAILLSAYLGGATATHVRVDEPFFFPIVFGVLIWVGLGLRQPTIFQLAMGNKKAAHD